MQTIALEGMTFDANHGYYPEEARLLTKFTVDVYITVNMSNEGNQSELHQTIDYAQAYNIVNQVFNIRHKILEAIAGNIVTRLKEKFQEVEKIKVRVTKWNPPVSGLVDKAYVELEL